MILSNYRYDSCEYFLLVNNTSLNSKSKNKFLIIKAKYDVVEPHYMELPTNFPFGR